jgi:hypothetical protein
MNQEQLKAAVRWFIASPMGVSIISHGWMTGSSMEFWGGMFVMAAPLVWSMFVHTEANAVAVVDTIAKQPDSPVKAVIMESTVAGREQAAALPGRTTVVAGSPEAVTLARAA